MMLLSLFPRRATAMPAPGNDAAAVNTLRADFGKTQLGRDMLRFAGNNGIATGFDATLQARGVLAEYNPDTSKAAVLPTLAPEEAVLNLSHELRHGWQDKVLKFSEKENGGLTPSQRWALRRYIEADACAFSAYFEAMRMKELGVTVKGLIPSVEITAAGKIAAEFNSPDGLTPDEYRKIAFEPCLGRLSAYNDKHLAFIDGKVKELEEAVAAAGQSPQQLSKLAADFDAAENDKVFEEYLRRFGGISLDPAARTPLQTPAVDSNTVTNKYPHREDDMEARITFPRRREETLGKLTDRYENQRIAVWEKTKGIRGP